MAPLWGTNLTVIHCMVSACRPPEDELYNFYFSKCGLNGIPDTTKAKSYEWIQISTTYNKSENACVDFWLRIWLIFQFARMLMLFLYKIWFWVCTKSNSTCLRHFYMKPLSNRFLENHYNCCVKSVLACMILKYGNDVTKWWH